jgi:hypothetical protein
MDLTEPGYARLNRTTGLAASGTIDPRAGRPAGTRFRPKVLDLIVVKWAPQVGMILGQVWVRLIGQRLGTPVSTLSEGSVPDGAATRSGQLEDDVVPGKSNDRVTTIHPV